MALYCGIRGEDVEIPSLEEDMEEGFVKVANKEDFELLVKAQGYASSGEFLSRTGYMPDELTGKFWTVIKDRIYFREDEKGVRNG
jgi:hypothetical protein